MKILCIVNPVSGGEDKSSLLTIYQDLATAAGDTASHYETTGDDDLTALLRQIETFEPDRLIAAGGDGTVQLACRALQQCPQPITLGVVPVGSANGLATSLGLPSVLAQSLDIAMHSPHKQPMDLLMVNDQYLCVHLLDMGVNARLIQLTQQNGARGMTGYAKHVLQAIQESPLLTYTVHAGGQTYQLPGYLLACTNAHRYGTGVALAEGSVSDGLFEIRIIEALSLLEAIKAGLTIFNIFVDKTPLLAEKHFTEASIDVNEPAPLQIDGEYIGEFTHIDVKIAPAAIPLALPADENP